MLRCFDDGNIIHVDGSVDPIRDKEIIDIELQLKDFETIDKKIQSLYRVIKSGDKDAVKENELALRIKTGLEQGLSVRGLGGSSCLSGRCACWSWRLVHHRNHNAHTQ